MWQYTPTGDTTTQSACEIANTAHNSDNKVHSFSHAFYSCKSAVSFV